MSQLLLTPVIKPKLLHFNIYFQILERRHLSSSGPKTTKFMNYLNFYTTLSTSRYTELFKTHMEYMERAKIVNPERMDPGSARNKLPNMSLNQLNRYRSSKIFIITIFGRFI